MRRQFTKSGLVSHQRNPPAFGALRQLRHHFFRSMPGRQGGEQFHRGFSRDVGRQQVGCLLRTDERAREDFIQSHVEPDETGHTLPEAGDAFLGQGALVVIGPVRSAFGGDRVPDDVEFTGRHWRVAALRDRKSVV